MSLFSKELYCTWEEGGQQINTVIVCIGAMKKTEKGQGRDREVGEGLSEEETREQRPKG